jgi:Flp pilus assembly protein TadG
MVTRKLNGSRRRGAATVETAVIMIPLVMLLFGVFEYGRLLMELNLVNNSAREGCRFAIVNNTTYSSTANLTTAVLNVVNSRMGGQQTKAFTGFAVSVAGTHNGSSVADLTTLVPGDMITVTVSGNYKFMNIIPYVHMSATLPMTSSVTMVCEGGM